MYVYTHTVLSRIFTATPPFSMLFTYTYIHTEQILHYTLQCPCILNPEPKPYYIPILNHKPHIIQCSDLKPNPKP